MSLRSLALGAPIFITVFLFQEAFVNQVRLPASGFTLFLAFAFIWAALSSPEVGGIAGFGAGLLLDLSSSSAGPFGLWTLIVAGISYGVAFLGYGDDRIQANAFSVVTLTVGAVGFAQLAYLLLGTFLGQSVGSLWQVMITLIGTALWNLLITPIIFPVVRTIHSIIYEGRLVA